MLLLLLLSHSIGSVTTDKCYSCSSPQLNLRWPKDEETNRLQYLSEFPWFSNESCDSVRSAIPMVDCPGSVCIKAVIKEPPAKRDVCVESGAVVRDCWSRVVKLADNSNYSLNPEARNQIVRMIGILDPNSTVGLIYTCKGFLCNGVGSFSLLTLSTAMLLII